MTRIGLRWPIAIALCWLALGGPARADCVSECEAATYCDSEMHASGECARKLNDCYINECSKTRYGAIAYDAVTGAVGWSYDFSDGPGAEQKALSGCAEHSSDCRVVLDFWNKCGALAADQNGHYDYGLGDSEDEAKSAAVAACGAGCEIQAWSCSK